MQVTDIRAVAHSLLLVPIEPKFLMGQMLLVHLSRKTM
jgi:hypothetical protein